MSFSLYVHIPYCLAKCPYCDFNSYAVSGEAKHEFNEAGYTTALLQELRHYAAKPEWQNQNIKTIFFGGGTPSLFSPDSISQIISEAQSIFGFAAAPEITLEANPGTIHEELGRKKLSDFRDAGINRISMGVQSFSQEKLKTLGRLHSGSEAIKAVENIKAAGFSNFNLDFIFAVTNETLESWNSDLQTAIALSPTHISAYSLTIEPGTEFHKLTQKGSLFTLNEESQEVFFKHTISTLEAAGYLQYEISNYAKPDFPCTHNLNYWERDNYLGLGAGAHTFNKHLGPYGSRWSNIPGPAQYIKRTSELGEAIQRSETLSESEADLEFFWLGLRKKSGLDLTTYSATFNKELPEKHQRTINHLIHHNLIKQTNSTIVLTDKGLLVADSVFSSFA